MEKAHKPTMENTKNAPSTTPSTMRAIYLVHDCLDFAIVWYTVV